ncbi:MAG TPA: sigma-54 dependent transcriptional regulator [Gemmatimonadaceae bacterium]|nr:sigma-54 dependent transcriptional regulator [Gemmatimonadaceae bacterium]
MSNGHPPLSANSVGHHDAVSQGARASLRVLVVECDDSLREGCLAVLRGEGYNATGVSQGDEAIKLITKRKFEIILVNLFMSGVSGMKILEAARDTYKESLIILMTGNPSVETNIRALQAGAWEYLAMPFTAEQLQLVVGRAAHELLAARGGVASPRPNKPALAAHAESASRSLIGISPSFCRAVELARKVAKTNASVMISGESGTGKEGIAHLIHQESRRNGKRFVAINCAALPAPLLESEMFGHKKGAFTGADRDKPGLLEVAHNGTLFLDELTEMPLALQAKLLRVIQDGVVRRVGSEQEDAVVDVRFISATNRNPEEAVGTHVLRDDLFYRLRVIPLHLPPLRERVEDVPLLANHFLAQYWRRHRVSDGESPTLAPSAIDFLTSRTWPGNVRELQNVMEHLAVLSDPGILVQADDLPIGSDASHGMAAAKGWPAHLMTKAYHPAKEAVLAHFEREYLAMLVARADRNMSKAARLAGIDRTTLYRLMEKHEVAERVSAPVSNPESHEKATPVEGEALHVPETPAPRPEGPRIRRAD